MFGRESTQRGRLAAEGMEFTMLRIRANRGRPLLPHGRLPLPGIVTVDPIAAVGSDTHNAPAAEVCECSAHEQCPAR